MKLDFVPLDKLSVSKTNMRWAKKAPDVSDILPTVRARGVIQPVIVRPCDPPQAPAGHDTGHSAPARGYFEILAGSRRFHAARLVAAEVAAEQAGTGHAADPGEIAMLPCAILEDGDDASAIEASLIENMARLAPDEVSQWQTFTRLVKEGRSPAQIAATFGLPDLAVRRVLALGNLLPRIRDLYAREEIDAATVRHLTLASKSQQKAWLALADDPDAYLPTGYQLKAWLMGGQSIAVARALFDVAQSGLATIADLFGEDEYFADAEAFWASQQEAVEARRAAYLDAGWADAVIVPPTGHFNVWEYEKAGKRKGGRVYIDVRATGEVVFHEGYVSHREAARLARAETGAASPPKPARPELTSTLQGYVDLHRHAALRAHLLGRPQVALRLLVAHAICGSHLWRVAPEPQASRNEAVTASLAAARGEAVFAEHRRAVSDLFAFAPGEPSLTGEHPGEADLVRVFDRLLELPDAVVLDVVAVVMGETLAAGSAIVEAAGLETGLDMAGWWHADEAFFALLRDRDLMGAMVAEVAGETIAAANAREKVKVLRAILRDHVEGANGRDKTENWVPRWMTFPPAAYTRRGGVGTMAAHARMLYARDEETPAAPAPAAAADSARTGGEAEAGNVRQPRPGAAPDPDEAGAAEQGRLAA